MEERRKEKESDTVVEPGALFAKEGQVTAGTRGRQGEISEGDRLQAHIGTASSEAAARLRAGACRR